MSRLPVTLLACLALAGATVIAGCGDDDSDDGASTAAPPPVATSPEATDAPPASGDVVKVNMKDIKFVPESVTVKVGQKILWTNTDGSIPHNVTAREGADFKSDNLNSGDTFEYTPTKAGKIAYVCTIHAGQNGTITVTG